jgi:hypothetical protein
VPLEVLYLRAATSVEIIRTVTFMLFGAWIIWLLKRRCSPMWGLIGVLGGNAAVWAMSTLPLPRLYAVGTSGDRLNNLGLSQVVAAGNSPLETVQVGHMHFEPFWSLLMAVVSGFDTERLPVIYAYMPLLIACAFVLTLFVGLRAPRGEATADPDASWTSWERVATAGFATLLSSLPFDYLEINDTPWAKVFLLKPNHAMGLMLFPLFLWLFVRARDVKRQIAAGLVLHLIGWAFVLHMAYICVGLATYVGLAALRRDWNGLRRNARETSIVVGVSVVIVSPYLAMLLIGYPFLVPTARATIAASSAHLLETTLKTGWIFWLGIWGIVVVWRRPGRLARAFEAQVIGSYVVWLAYYALSAIRMAREIDEIFFWTRFLVAASAGIGAWDLARRAFSACPARERPATRAAILALVLVTQAIPYWWNPLQMDDYFRNTLKPLPASIVESMRFLRQDTDPKAAVVSDARHAQYVSALGARRTLLSLMMGAPKDYERRFDLQDRLIRGENLDQVHAALESYDVRYLLVSDALIGIYPRETLTSLFHRQDLTLEHMSGTLDEEFVAIFRIARRDPP